MFIKRNLNKQMHLLRVGGLYLENVWLILVNKWEPANMIWTSEGELQLKMALFLAIQMFQRTNKIKVKWRGMNLFQTEMTRDEFSPTQIS